jgi:transposase
MKLLVDARQQSVGERTRVLNRLHAHLVILLPGYERTVPTLAASRHRREVASLLASQGGVRAELARAELTRVGELDAECLALEGRLRALVRSSGSSLPTIVGVADITAAKIMGETGDPRRFRSVPAFAAMSGTAPIPARASPDPASRVAASRTHTMGRSCCARPDSTLRARPSLV